MIGTSLNSCTWMVAGRKSLDTDRENESIAS